MTKEKQYPALPPSFYYTKDGIEFSKRELAQRMAIEQHRRECEARGVLDMPFKQRRAWLNEIEKFRGGTGTEKGIAARLYLEHEVRRQFKIAKQSKTSQNAPETRLLQKLTSANASTLVRAA